MPRDYSEQFLIAVNKLDDDSYGVKLARGCIKANIPAQYIADALGVSRMTIHSWFRGKPVRHKNTQRIKLVLAHIDIALLAGSLPAINPKAAKSFADDLKEAISTAQ
jgi:hypothetical protein